MSLSTLVAKIIQRSSLELPLPRGEVANLPRTPLTKLGAYLLALGLWYRFDKDERQLGMKFTKQMAEIVPVQSLAPYQIKAAWVRAYAKPQIGISFVPTIKSYIRRYATHDPEVTAEELNFIKFAANFALEPGKPNYLNRARAFAAQFSAMYLNNFNKVVESGEDNSVGGSAVTGLVTELVSVLAQLLGRKPKKGEYAIPNATLVERSRNDPDYAKLVRDYKAIKRKLSVSYDIDYQAYMAKRDNKPVALQEAYNYMAGLGYVEQRLPQLGKSAPILTGIDNGKIKHYALDGRALSSNIPSNVTEITLQRTYDAEAGTGAYLSYKAPMSNGPTRVYTEAHKNTSAATKIETVTKVTDSIKKVLPRWKSDLKSTDPLKMLAATACYTVYLTAMRVGARQNSAASMTGKPTYGAISLRPRHVRVLTNSIKFKYEGKASGKSGLMQEHTIAVKDDMTKLLKNNYLKLLENKKTNDLVFSYKKVTLTYTELRNYLKTSGYPAGIHKLRFVHGTAMVQELLSKNAWSPSTKNIDNLPRKQKEAEEWMINTVLIPAGNLLGHKGGGDKTLWRTTIKSYIDTTIVAAWFKDHGLRQPKWLPKQTTTED